MTSQSMMNTAGIILMLSTSVRPSDRTLLNVIFHEAPQFAYIINCRFNCYPHVHTFTSILNFFKLKLGSTTAVA